MENTCCSSSRTWDDAEARRQGRRARQNQQHALRCRRHRRAWGEWSNIACQRHIAAFLGARSKLAVGSQGPDLGKTVGVWTHQYERVGFRGAVQADGVQIELGPHVEHAPFRREEPQAVVPGGITERQQRLVSSAAGVALHRAEAHAWLEGWRGPGVQDAHVK